MYDQLFPEKTEQAFEARLQRPLEPQPTQRFSGWGLLTAAPKGLAAGAAQGIGSTSDLLDAYGQVMAATDAKPEGMFSVNRQKSLSDVVLGSNEQARASQKLLSEGLDFRSEAGRSFRNVARDYIPDPMTTHASERVVFDLTRVGGKAVTAALTLGGIPGAVVAGAEEGFTMADDLAEQGVDKATRTKVGAVNAVMNAGAFAMPIAGRTWAQTGALAVAGGPAAFIGQNAATRQILQDADYTKLADQYDPFDPLGLALSTVLPLGFGALAMRGRKASVPAPADDVVDAARVALLRENVDVHNPAPSLDTADAHVKAYSHAMDQMAGGEKVTVSEHLSPEMAARASEQMWARQIETKLAESDLPETQRPVLAQMFRDAEQRKPAFDNIIQGIADEIGGFAKLAGIKGVERTTAKVMADYGGDPTKLKDLLRATIQVESADAANAAVASIFERFKVLETGRRNLLDPSKSPADGYRDAKFNVMVDGHVAEVQISVPAMLKAKKNGGHDLYKEREALQRKYEGQVLPKSVAAKIDAINGKMKKIYDAAWTESTNARNSSSDTGAPLRWADEESNTRGGSVSQASENLTPGTSGLSDTGMPSTSKSSALGPKDGSFISTSETTIAQTGPDSKLAGDFLTKETERLAQETPDIPVLLEGMDQPMPLSEAMARIKQDLDADMADVPLLQAAAECFIQSGGV